MNHDSLKALDNLHALIDWSRIESILKAVRNSKKGERAFHPVVMFKVLLLQKMYALSDSKMEQQLARDLLFRRFAGLSLSDDTPDHSTIWLFHKLLGDRKLIDELFDEVFKQLERQHIIITSGSVSIIDASVVEAKNKRPQKNKQTSEKGINSQDKEASYNVKKDSSGHRKTT